MRAGVGGGLTAHGGVGPGRGGLDPVERGVGSGGRGVGPGGGERTSPRVVVGCLACIVLNKSWGRLHIVEAFDPKASGCVEQAR